MEKWLHNEILYDGKIVRLRVGEVELDHGGRAKREVVEHPGGVGVVPVHEGRVILVRQHRIAIGGGILEIPAGKIEAGDDLEFRAKEELEEEIGFTPGRLVPVGYAYCSPGFTNQRDYIFLAFDLTPCPPRPEHDEFIEIVPIPLEEARRLLAEHRIDDAKTIIGLYKLFSYLNAEK